MSNITEEQKAENAYFEKEKIRQIEERRKREEEEAKWYNLNYQNYIELRINCKILREKREQMTVGAFEKFEADFKEFVEKKLRTLAQEYLNVVAQKEFPNTQIKVYNHDRYGRGY